jgi:uncharacterized membrane protein YkgB
MSIEKVDVKIIKFFRKVSIPVARISLFVVFFWFGLLKVIGLSPASALVQRLFEHTISFIPFGTFLIVFGIFECLIGILFLVKGAERVVIPLLLVHMITTAGPLFLLPSETWQRLLVPTLEGQYIIKNLVIIATGISLAAHLHPIHSDK